MKQFNLFLVSLSVICCFIIWAQTTEYRGLNNDNNILRLRNERLEEENRKIDSIIIINKIFIDSIILEKTKIDIDNKKLRIKDSIRQVELKSIKGRYKKLTNDSLLISLKKAYEADSISNINK